MVQVSLGLCRVPDSIVRRWPIALSGRAGQNLRAGVEPGRRWSSLGGRQEERVDYLVMIYRDERDPDEYMPDYAAYAKALVEAGVMREARKLKRSRTGATVAVRGGETLVTDGPFAETHEQIGGYFVLACADFDEALAWAKRCPGAVHGTVEVRPLDPV
jgi:hypothetical protein